MRLEDAQNEEQVVAALKAGDPQLEDDIWREVRDKVEAAPPWDEGFMLDEGLMLDQVNQEAVLEEIRDLYGPRLAILPPGLWEDEFWEQVEKAAMAYSKGSNARLRTGLLYFASRPASYHQNPVHQVTSLPSYWEAHVQFDEPLIWVPSSTLQRALDTALHNAAWEDLGDGNWTSGWLPDYHDMLGLYVGDRELREWITDLRQDYFSKWADAEPKEVAKQFLRTLATEYPALAKKVKKAKLPTDALAGYAGVYFEDPEVGLVVIQEATGAFGYEGTRGEVLLEVTKSDLRELGITTGKWWDGAPWELLNLPKEELAYEGVLMRHCVGRPDMGYREAVENGEIYVWSLRSRFNKPVLTWEVGRDEWDRISQRTDEQLETYAEARLVRRMRLARTEPGFSLRRWMRGTTIRQLKGRLNRVPPKDTEEDKVVRLVLRRLEVDPTTVEDFQPRPRPNPRGPRRTFDEPYGGRRQQPRRRRHRRRTNARRRSTSVRDIVRRALR